MDFLSISEIEKIRAISSPHEKELKMLGGKWVRKFRRLEEDRLTELARLIGGRKESLGLDEEWALTKEFFPEVKAHLSYYYYGEEFKGCGPSRGGEDALRFLFSGKVVRDVTGEDLSGLIEVMLNFIGSYLMNQEILRSGKEIDRKMLEKAYEARKGAFEYLRLDDEKEIKEAADYLGARYEKMDSKFVFWKEFFSGVEVGIELDEGLEFIFSGDKLDRLTDYDFNLLAIFTLNHMIRFIAKKHLGRDLPGICSKVFP